MTQNFSTRWTALLVAMSLAYIATLAPAAAQSEHYVSDELEITLRKGPGTKFGIIRMLKSGTPVNIVEENGKGYAKVTTSDGTNGWVLTRFLLDEPVARERLAEHESTLRNLQLENDKVLRQLQEMQQLQANLARSEGEIARLRAENEKVKSAAADTLTIQQQNQALKADIEEFKQTQKSLVEENTQLADGSRQDWFMVGAGVIILGILIGLAIPNIRWKQKRTSMGSSVNIDF